MIAEQSEGLPGMTTYSPRQREDRFEFVNGARGIAAFQVLLLHYCSFFFPAFARTTGEGNYALEAVLTHTPLFFLIDGYTAVSLFFVMSGFVLAPAFEKSPLGMSGGALKRFVRLFIPIAASVILATALLAVFHNYKSLAATASGSAWAMGLLEVKISSLQTLKEIVLNSMILGYQGPSLFSSLPLVGGRLPPIAMSTNSPMWTLHLEFWGSLLTLAFAVAYRSASSKPFFWTVFIMISAITGTGLYSLFMIGFAAYHFRFKIMREGYACNVFGLLLIALGIFVASVPGDRMATLALSLISKVTFMQAKSPYVLNTGIGAVIILLGLCMSASAKRLLSSAPALWLGKISFSLYLIHFPILFTLGAWVFVKALGTLGYLSSVLVVFLICIPLTVFLASLFEAHIDRRAIAASRSSERYLGKKPTLHRQPLLK